MWHVVGSVSSLAPNLQRVQANVFGAANAGMLSTFAKYESHTPRSPAYAAAVPEALKGLKTLKDVLGHICFPVSAPVFPGRP